MEQTNGTAEAEGVMLFCPVRGDQRMVSQGLVTHRALGVDERLYFDDSADPQVSELLEDEARHSADRVTVKKVGTDGRPVYDISGPTHLWDAALCSRVQAMRQAACDALMMSGRRYLFMVDLDVWCHPGTVGYLEGQGKEIVSAVYWSKWNPAMPWLPNVWDIQHYGYFGPDSVLRLREPGIYPVGGLGACTLICRSAVAKGADYRPVPSLPWAFEDRHFNIRAHCAGVELWAATALPPFHVYRADMWNEGLAWYNAGAEPDYFAKRWLTEGWADNIRALVPELKPVGAR